MDPEIDERDNDRYKVLIDVSLCSDTLKTHLKKHHIQFELIAPHQDIVTMTRASNIDAVIVGELMMQSVIKELDKYDFLLLLGLASTPSQVSLNTQIDGILPSDPALFIYQLTLLLKQRSERHSLTMRLNHIETDNETRKRKLREINLLKNAIVRNVSHELRTPLLQVKSAVALIGEDTTDKKLVNYAQNAVSRLETHIKHITLLGHSLDTNPNPIILRDAIEYAKRNLTRIWTRSADAERIHVNLEPNLPPIIADKQGFSTVLQLLMDNALKFGNDEVVEIIGRKSGDKVYVAICDSGIGIAEDKLQDIFDSFYQVDDTSTRPYGGAGVGLALVKFILENHGIIIHVDSQLNKGSTFWFEIPFVDLDDLN